MQTERTQSRIDFQRLGERQVCADFTGGDPGDGGVVVLLAESENKQGTVAQLTECFTDHRNPDVDEHSLSDLLKQRLFAIRQGYEDLVDHDMLRREPMPTSNIKR